MVPPWREWTTETSPSLLDTLQAMHRAINRGCNFALSLVYFIFSIIFLSPLSTLALATCACVLLCRALAHSLYRVIGCTSLRYGYLFANGPRQVSKKLHHSLHDDASRQDHRTPTTDASCGQPGWKFLDGGPDHWSREHTSSTKHSTNGR